MQALCGLGLAAAYFVVHPAYFGDALWYASDLRRSVEQQTALPLDAGHLLWRPLGLLTWRALRTLLPAIDPLDALKLVTSAGTALACLGCYHLALRFGLQRSTALCAAVVLVGSNVCLAYGGSGSSYTPAMAALVFAALPLVRTEGEWSVRHAAGSTLAFVVAWGFWAVSVLLLPALFVAAALHASGPPARRLLRGALLGAAALGAATLTALASYGVWGASPAPGFLAWLRASGHGIEAGPSPLGAPRAVYGFLRSFVHFDSLGPSVKGLLLGDPGLVRPEQLGGAIAVGVPFLVLLGLALGGLVRAVRNASGPALRVASVAAAAIAPVAAFGVLWQGSDVERFSGCLPFAAIAVALGLRSAGAFAARWRLEWAMAATLLAGNSATLVVPALVRGGGLPMELARTADRSMPAHSLLVITGGDLSASVWGPVLYFSDVDVYSVDFEAQRNGAERWKEQLTAAVRRAVSGGGGVAVLSDLIGEPTPGGIGLSVRERPRPSLAEVAGYFSTWTERGRWSVGRFTFVQLEPPPTYEEPLKRDRSVDDGSAGWRPTEEDHGGEARA